ncbi:hypothetical protein [Halomonas marinisediminis]|uniref:DUF3261 domain-containing protein n=1 Tax=Halomonas marinisediminis TaxID=2546095 RepID=A0ABY2D9S8_9GAMM|nr:hypothetical protein [Halomonas marinisediminis]TDB04786.1 hypothetical protein E0702_04515 [Halomonas marinisediminis]
MTPPSRLTLLALLALLTGCAGAPERPDSTIRQALFNLGERAATRVMAAPELPRPPSDQVLLLSPSEVDDSLGIEDERFQESLVRALLAVSDGPQVLDWGDGLSEGGDNQWQLESHLEADGPRLTLSDRELLPYRLKLTLRRPGEEAARWQASLQGALDATAL